MGPWYWSGHSLLTSRAQRHCSRVTPLTKWTTIICSIIAAKTRSVVRHIRRWDPRNQGEGKGWAGCGACPGVIWNSVIPRPTTKAERDPYTQAPATTSGSRKNNYGSGAFSPRKWVEYRRMHVAAHTGGYPPPVARTCTHTQRRTPYQTYVCDICQAQGEHFKMVQPEPKPSSP